MSLYTLERKFAAPAACTDCHWNGKIGELMSCGTDRAGTLRCPKCLEPNVVFIEALSTDVLQ